MPAKELNAASIVGLTRLFVLQIVIVLVCKFTAVISIRITP